VAVAEHLVWPPVLAVLVTLRQQAHHKETMVEQTERNHLHSHRAVAVAQVLLVAMVVQRPLVQAALALQTA
jgi:hypothetical protein